MDEESRWDPEMRAAQVAHDAAAAAYPPIRLEFPFEPQRAINDALALLSAAGGPVMAESEDRWVAARGRRILCRLHRPRTDRMLPGLVYFHGGGWVWSSVDTHDRLAREYAAAGEVAVVSVDYTLSPEAQFPQALEECAAVVGHLAENGSEWGIDPSRLLVGGDSAGGNLALAAALLLRETSGPPLRGILALYPVCDAAQDTPSYREFAEGYVLTAAKMRFYWDVYAPRAADRLNPLASPLHADLTGLPPVLIHLAELDVLRSEGEALAKKLAAAGVSVACEVFPGMIHGFLRATGRVARAREAVGKGGAWLKRQSA
ncbi:MAG TPA: alpha/beta hydrolase [Acetobacteraceae bacterium]|nr:alpha/beta hydrolase [Acetobacteraceae bacterium]